ncbi:MAG: S8 family serine peptidase, partial [Nocardioidaceae bacterium]
MPARPQLPACAVALVVGTLLLGTGPGAAADGTDPARSVQPGVYVVTLSAAPSASYDGGVRGLLPTRPAGGRRFDRTRPAVAAYTRWLEALQDRLLHRIGDPVLLYRYTTALDGFAVALSGEQVRDLRAQPEVLRVERSIRRHLDRTLSMPAVGSSTRTLLGLSGRTGAWARHGGPARAGHDVVVGVVDSGVWPENPGFARTAGASGPLPGFHGGCSTGERWTPADCTDKVVSARWFVRGFGEEGVASADYLSPRDGTGHGSHVASVAVGDHGVRVEVDGQRFGTTSGMAPAARLAVYKACWTAPDPAEDGCTTADTVAAVDSAVSDGVDVLSASVGGSQVRDDSVERAFLGAATAGVFVAASAGNSGRSGAVAHVAPWVTTVAASTHHDFTGAVRLGDGRTLIGAMASDRRVRSAPLVLGATIGAPGATPSRARTCAAGALDAAKAQGAIVVCDRGAGSRVGKSASVADAGGVAMVLANTRREGVDADLHAVPTVHLAVSGAAVLERYVRRAGVRATASLDPTVQDGRGVPALAGFSARGPAVASGGDVLKPDLAAPGVGVLGAVAPPSDGGRSWDLVSGTSASAPHVAGLAAFVAGVRPGWSPARVKSAMMTTADDLAGRHGPLAEGAGQVDPGDVLDPGLVFDADPSAWQRVAAGTEPARDVNAASVAVGDLVGPTTVRRRITNVGTRRESYSVRVRGLRGVDVQAFPATVRLAPGQSRTVRLRITARPTAPVDHDVTGWLVWRGDRHRVRVPVSVRPMVVAAPRQVDGAGGRGRVVVRGRSGNGRTLKLRSSGLVPATATPVRLRGGGPGTAHPTVRPDTLLRSVRVPAGTAVARFAVTGAPGVDLSVVRAGSPTAPSAGLSNRSGA